MLAVPQHTRTERLSCPLHPEPRWRPALCTPLGRCRRQCSHCTKDSKRRIRYNAYRLLRPSCHAEAYRSIMSTAVLEGGYVREDIRLGNEALTRQDLDIARQYFQQVLVS